MNTLKWFKISCCTGTALFVLAAFAPIASAAAPTGTCGLVASLPHPEIDWYSYEKDDQPEATKNMDILAEINFTAGTVDYSVTQFAWTGPSGTPANTFKKTTIAGHTTFTMTGPGSSTGASAPGTGDSTPNSYQIMFTTTGGKTVKLNVLPVNSGNTYLIQGVGTRISGVCQAF